MTTLDEKLTEATRKATESAPMAWDWIHRDANKVLMLRLAQYLLAVVSEDEQTADELMPWVYSYWQATQKLAQDPSWTWETAWSEFCILWDHKLVKHAKGNAIQEALKIAKSQPTAPELLQFHDPDTRLLGQTCRTLADTLNLNAKFFMACSSAATIINKSRPTAQAKLHLLCRHAILTPTNPPNHQTTTPKNFKPTQWFTYLPLVKMHNLD